MPYKDKDKAREYNRIKKKEYYHRNPDKFNKERAKYKKSVIPIEKQKIYSARYYLKNRLDRIRYRKQYGQQNKEKINEYQKKRAREIDPSLRIADSISDYKRGNIGHDEFIRRVQQVIDYVDEKYKGK